MNLKLYVLIDLNSNMIILKEYPFQVAMVVFQYFNSNMIILKVDVSTAFAIGVISFKFQYDNT